MSKRTPLRDAYCGVCGNVSGKIGGELDSNSIEDAEIELMNLLDTIAPPNFERMIKLRIMLKIRAWALSRCVTSTSYLDNE
jgi:hypothetical protein